MGVWIYSKGTASQMKPIAASGVVGAMTTICAQQHKQPSPEQSLSESPVLWVEKRQVSGDISSQAKISVAARSSTKSVTTRRTVYQCAMKFLSPYSAIGRRWTPPGTSSLPCWCAGSAKPSRLRSSITEKSRASMFLRAPSLKYTSYSSEATEKQDRVSASTWEQGSTWRVKGRGPKKPL